jgi:hypothetical protein
MGDDNARYYLAMWKSLLRAFLGWSEERVMKWADDTKMLAALQNPDDILFNRPPQYWVVGALIPTSLRSRLTGTALMELQKRIFDVFRDEHDYEFPVDVDWMPYRDKVNNILGEYGEHLKEGE